MPAEFNYRTTFQGNEYELVAFDEIELLAIDWQKKYGMRPFPVDSVCGEGYWCEFKAQKEGIFLTDLYIHCQYDRDYKPIEGSWPQPVPYSKERIFADSKGLLLEVPTYQAYRHYTNLNIKTYYRGKVLLGRDFDGRYSVSFGYQKALAYRDLLELTYDMEGKLAEVKDRSAWSAKKRAEKTPEEFFEEESMKFVKLRRRWYDEQFDL